MGTIGGATVVGFDPIVLRGETGATGPQGPPGVSPQYALPAPSGSATTDDANIAAAITAVGAAGGVIQAQAGTYLFGVKHDFLNADLRGQGGGAGVFATNFQATTVASQFEFSGGGSLTCDFAIDGHNVATIPLSRVPYTAASSGRTFARIRVTSNANDGTGTNPLVRIISAQNDLYEQVTLYDWANDGLLLDGGTGGHAFNRCELNGARSTSRYHLRIDKQVASPYVYPTVADVEFNQCILEGTGGVSQVYVVDGFDVKFDGTDLFSVNKLTGASMDVLAGTGISVGNASVQQVGAPGLQTGSVGIRVAGAGQVKTFGRMSYFNLDTAQMLIDAAANIDNKQSADFYNCNVQRGISGAALVTQYANYFDGTNYHRSQYSNTLVEAFFNNGQDGLKFSVDSEGKQGWYTGASAAFTPDVVLSRLAAGVVGVGPQQVLATGSGTTAQRPATATVGSVFFDTTLGKPVWKSGSGWVDSAGGAV